MTAPTEAAPQRRKPLRIILNILGWVISIGFLVVFWQQLGAQDGWEEVFANLNWGYFALASVILFIGHYGRSQMGYISTLYLGYPITHGQSQRYWSLSQLAKYLPGGVWLFAAKVVLYNNNGMPLMVASAATMWELLAILMIGLGFGVLSLGALSGVEWAGPITLGAVILISGMLLSLMFWPWRLLQRLHLKGAQRMVDILSALGSKRFNLLGYLSISSLVIWVITGIGFYVLLLGLQRPEPISVWYAIVTYAVSWTIGFLIFVTPAGLGAREAALTLLLTPVYGVETAFSIALLARVWWALVEGLHILIALLWYVIKTDYRSFWPLSTTETSPAAKPEQHPE